jgi:hypothetical protein
MPPLNDVLAGSLAQAVQVQQIIDGLKGTPSKGVPISLTALSDTNNYALTVKNNDPTNSRALSVLKADGTTLISADVTGVTLASPLHIPAGSITTTEILDGTIQTADIAVSAVQQRLAFYASTPVFSTSATATWVATPATVTTTTFGNTIRLDFMATLQHNVANAQLLFQVVVDSAVAGTLGQTTFSGTASSPLTISGTTYTAPSPGSHTFAIYVYEVTAGTLSATASVPWTLNVTEQKR